MKAFMPPHQLPLHQSDDGATPAAGSTERRSRYTRTPSEYAVHILLDGGHREEVRFQSLDDFRQWYGQEVAPKVLAEELIKVPMKTGQGEFMVVRASKINGIRVEPVYSSSVDRY
jgi:hypothetical protein